MFNCLFPKLTLAAVFFALSFPGFSQVAPSATQGGLPIEVGAGFSNYNIDFDGYRLSGPTIWVDWNFYEHPAVLHGFGLEVEGRDLGVGKPASYAGSLREDTAMGGVIYKWHDFHHVRPYGKFLLGYGKIEFAGGNNPNYTNDSRTIYSPGFGLDYRAYRNISVRADYEYQIWPNLFGPSARNPQGFTIGASYDFRGSNSR